MSACENIGSKTKRVCIGSLSKRITLQTRSTLNDSVTGEIKEGFTDTAIVWSDVRTVGGGVRYFNGVQLGDDITHIFTIRKRKDLTQETWILYNEERFDIKHIDTLNESGRFMSLYCGITGDDDYKGSDR